jgi:hypothetical protein
MGSGWQFRFSRPTQHVNYMFYPPPLRQSCSSHDCTLALFLIDANHKDFFCQDQLSPCLHRVHAQVHWPERRIPLQAWHPSDQSVTRHLVRRQPGQHTKILGGIIDLSLSSALLTETDNSVDHFHFAPTLGFFRYPLNQSWLFQAGGSYTRLIAPRHTEYWRRGT